MIATSGSVAELAPQMRFPSLAVALGSHVAAQVLYVAVPFRCDQYAHERAFVIASELRLLYGNGMFKGRGADAERWMGIEESASAQRRVTAELRGDQSIVGVGLAAFADGGQIAGHEGSGSLRTGRARGGAGATRVIASFSRVQRTCYPKRLGTLASIFAISSIETMSVPCPQLDASTAEADRLRGRA